MINAFNIARLPRILFGPGAVQQLPELAARYGKHALLVAGRAAIRDTRIWAALLSSLEAHGMTWLDVKVETEPSPHLVDAVVARLRDCEIDVVIGIGGGSALDAAKAIAGLLRPGNSVMAWDQSCLIRAQPHPLLRCRLRQAQAPKPPKMPY